MERRKAVTAAAAASAIFLLGAAGVTANATILASHDGGGVGKISPVPTTVTRPEARPGDGPTTMAEPSTVLRSTTPATVAAPAPTPASGAASGSAAGSPAGRGSTSAGSGPTASVSAPNPSATPARPTTRSGGSPVAESDTQEDDRGELDHEVDHPDEQEQHDGAEDDD